MKTRLTRAVAIGLLAAFIISASSACATRRKCDGRRGTITPMGLM